MIDRHLADAHPGRRSAHLHFKIPAIGLLSHPELAQLVARNIAVETLTDPEPPAFGATGGVTIDGGRRWRWSRVVARSPEARIQQIGISVEPEEGGPGRAALIIFLRAQQ